ncbi:UNVERIFIED_CONTAM: G-type lectin S-receptor-like serine/threonine-protein kinase [Sesamum latifolium]|uniref:non-specific serine/threonine protein kinase n=1 Tax=Sesamum latifolium TaxID=2727402 RepID=A0AAW2TQS6_9LAMI
MASRDQSSFQDFLPLMAEKLGGDGLIGELCNGFRLLMDSEKGVITFESLKKNSALLGLQELSDDDLYGMLREGDFDGDGALNQMEFCVLMFRLSPELMEQSELWLEEALQQEGFQDSCVLLKTSALTESITASQSLRDGETMVSNGGSFELGFFSPGSSKNRYLGIWYKNIPVRTIVWVANRKNPIKDLPGSLTINSTGSLLLSDGTNTVVWSTNSTRIPQSPVAQLLDSGNLVVRDIKDGDAHSCLWQSFDYPSDTLLPGMKLGWDLRTHLNRRLSSWKSSDDPSPGELSTGIELDVYPQGVMRKGSRKYFRGGPWNGLRFSGAPELKSNPLFDFKFVSNQDEVYYQYRLLNTSVITRLVLNETTSTRQRYVWAEPDMSWKLYASVPRDYCDTYGLCGANGICIISDSPVCKCLEGFKPNLPQSWDAMDWSRGCIHNEPLDCRRKHGFIKFSGLKLPDTTYSWLNESMNLWECREECLKNCSCTAYTNSDIRGNGNGCALWFGDLVDIRQVSGGGQDLYIRMPTSHRVNPLTENRSPVRMAMIVVPIALVCGLLLGICYCFRQMLKPKGENEEDDHPDVAQGEDLDLPLFDLATVSRATENFSVNKKLGEGGFGPVYKGLLVDGQNIAVKRLSMSSGQGLNEFKNEVKLIAKLQHRNLVKLLGCCIDGDEKILIYEYMPNGSLDSFLFDQTRGPSLDWSKRFNIVCGIARGLLYLHQDSRLRIIHRDLKASNVLLDDELNPKISDFGMARTFAGDQVAENTRRIVGTYGYMAPEYALYGLFSVKSDVFSFGILLLEIVSGKKNRGFDPSQNHHNLIGYAWQLWTEGRPLELVDSSLGYQLVQPEVKRCIHIGLLCVQQIPEDRPNMSTVVLMLNGESSLPQPKQPGLLIDVVPSETCSSSSKNESCSVTDFTITTLEAR